MLPKILQQLNAPALGGLRQVASALRGDPRALMSRFGNAPQMQEAQRLISAAGGDPRKAFYELARQRGVDPDEILSALK